MKNVPEPKRQRWYYASGIILPWPMDDETVQKSLANQNNQTRCSLILEKLFREATLAWSRKLRGVEKPQ